MHQFTNLVVIFYFIIVANCQMYEKTYFDTMNATEATKSSQSRSIWCPNNMKQIIMGSDAFQACRPLPCLEFSNASVIDEHNELVIYNETIQFMCPDTRSFSSKMSSGLCNYVRLIDGRDFYINHANGSLFEFRTNFSYKLGDYYYYPDAGEAVICRDKLLPEDATDEMITWCSMYQMSLNETEKYANGSLYLKNLDHVVRRGFYHEYNSKKLVDVCLHFQPKLWRCKYLYDVSQEFFHIQPDLKLWTNDGVELVYPVGEYVMTVSNALAMTCVESAVKIIQNEETFYAYGIASIVSAVFIFVTFIVHLFYRKLNYHAKALLCHIICLLVMYITMAVRAFVNFNKQSDIWKMVVFSFQYISALSAFLWLNVLAFELWKAFSSQHGHQGVMSNDSKKKLWFVLKCIYAWGIPAILCLLIIGLSYSITAANTFHLIPINIWFASETSLFTFFYTPIIIILIANLVFFFMTMNSIRQASRGTQIVNRNANKNVLRVFVKLFIIMGICWLAEAISLVLLSRTPESVWYFTDIINSLQGVAIFFVYICKKSTWKVLKSRWKSYKTKRNDRKSNRKTATQVTIINLTRIRSTDE